MKKEEKLTREDWLRLGAILKITKHMLSLLDYDVSRSIGKSKKESKMLRDIYYRFDEVQSKLDDMVCRVDTISKIFGGENTIDATKVFYGDPFSKEQFFKEQGEYIKKFLKNDYLY